MSRGPLMKVSPGGNEELRRKSRAKLRDQGRDERQIIMANGMICANNALCGVCKSASELKLKPTRI